jgi:copper homeostasis protein CutC
MLLEVCVESARGLAAAITGGADRIELCTALSVGGLTPPASLIRIAAAAPCPVHLLARVREGDFVHDAAEAAQVADDIRTAADAGLAGVVIGASALDRQLDQALLAKWIAHARALGEARGRPLSLTLHRAFDLTPDLDTALGEAIDLGFDRILTSGGEPRAVDGCAALARLHARARGRIVLLAGSGVSAETLPAILATGVREVHASCRASRPVAADAPEYRFGFVGRESAETDPAQVAALAAALRANAA